MKFAARLKYLRKRDDLKQKELADILGLSRSTITKYESGEREPDYDTIKKIASYFHVKVDDLLDEGDGWLRNPPVKGEAAKEMHDIFEHSQNQDSEYIGTTAAHRNDDLFKDLDPEDQKTVNNLIKFLRSQKKQQD